MPTPPDTDNGRVTLALLGAKLDTVIDRLDNLCSTQEMLEDILHQHDVTIERLDGRVTAEVLTARVERQRIDGRVDRTDDKVRVWQAGQGGLSIVLAAIAAWFGTRY